MDFVARAGYVLDRAHRLTGILLFTLALMVVLVIYAWGTNASLQSQLRDATKNLSVYVVPGSEPGFFSPSKGEILMQTFADYAVQSLNTYTPSSLPKQYGEMQRFFTPGMLIRADQYFSNLVRDSVTEERSSLFVTDRTSIKTRRAEDAERGTDAFEVQVNGERKDVVGGKVVASTPIRVILRLHAANVSETNPFGYVIANYKEEVINAQGSN